MNYLLEEAEIKLLEPTLEIYNSDNIAVYIASLVKSKIVYSVNDKQWYGQNTRTAIWNPCNKIFVKQLILDVLRYIQKYVHSQDSCNNKKIRNISDRFVNEVFNLLRIRLAVNSIDEYFDKHKDAVDK
jgi:hypothetical protein